MLKHALWLIVLGFASVATAAEPVKSGPQVGDKVPGPFEPFNVTGMNAGEESCIFCKFGHDPSVMIFAKDISEPLTSLIKKLDEQNIKFKKKDLGTCVIFSPKATDKRTAIATLAKKQELKEIILATMDDAPKGYAINPDADVTVLLYQGASVKVNHAFRKGELDEKKIATIVQDLEKILPKK
ncbi:MAG: hypothetical protein K8T89_13785 [Planctomycetes bacterium]|nr:hypothetical protein [Planctomycetota bacterium]